ncbi:hypothetical protein [Burkholderia territorii]|uniref:hypothetical protein n=1 Tax=Burkholderia territorii TaxID=1503055 RepID=UPI000AB0F193|nr:hypothetical protein [Burkholderia territorii]
MLIREQGRLIKVLRVNDPDRSSAKARPRERVIGMFRADEPIPAALLDSMTYDEHKALIRWLIVYQESEALTDERPYSMVPRNSPRGV